MMDRTRAIRNLRLMLGKPVGAAPTSKPTEALLSQIRKELGYTKEEQYSDPEIDKCIRRVYYQRRGKQLYEASRGIGDLPPCADVQRREACRTSLRLFIETYCRTADKFNLPWASFHLEVLRKLQGAITTGGLFAMALPRSSGKTALTERAILWALLYGYRHYVVCIADGKQAALEILDTVQMEIESNELLQADFPEVCYPIKQLGGVQQRAAGQTYHGWPTNIVWGSSGTIVLPTIEGSASSGGILVTAGLNSRLRGMKHTTADGAEYRPDFVFLDDPQNDRSANSASQTDKRLKIVRGTVLGLAGAGKKLAGVMACTVIRQGDLADTLLDRKQSPEWNGVRYSLLESMPTNDALWSQYHEIWADSQRRGNGIADATAFYASHRREMDEGALASWPERYEHDEISAIQYAMDKLYQAKDAFFAEYQNQPVTQEQTDTLSVKPSDVIAKISGVKRRIVPADATRIVAYIDVQKGVLPYMVTAFADTGTAYVIDYGTYPEQPSPYWTMGDLQRSYMQRGMGLEGALTAALEALCSKLLDTAWIRQDGAEMHIGRCLVDAAWGMSTPTVLAYCQRSTWAGVLMPSFGRSLTADKKPFSEYHKQAGQTIGDFWLVTKHRTGIRVIEIDVNSAKSLWRQRLLTPMGDKGSWQVFGAQHDNLTIEYHKCLADQLCAEYAIPTTGRNRVVEVWHLYAGRDNHYLDCAAGCYAAASEQGMSMTQLSGLGDSARKRRTCRLPSARA